ncbi:hypothetical protein [Hypericibacter sp.]|uniref:hypothetical protein n=1 Tax=Hypericibacter sp. TaxID=2705401 RepID=UPI003D6D6790
MCKFRGTLGLLLLAGIAIGGLSACSFGNHHGNGNGNGNAGWDPTPEPHSRGSHA